MQGIPPIEPIVELEGICKGIAIALTLSILLFPLPLSLLFWYFYDDIGITVGIFLFLQIVSGVIVSKLRVMSVSVDQGEISYSTYEVVSRYLDKYFCKSKDENDTNISGMIDLK